MDGDSAGGAPGRPQQSSDDAHRNHREDRGTPAHKYRLRGSRPRRVARLESNQSAQNDILDQGEPTVLLPVEKQLLEAETFSGDNPEVAR